MKDVAQHIVAIARGFGLMEREQVCCGTVTVPQCVVLQRLLAGATDVGSLARDTGSSQSAMTRLLDGLVRREWVDRVRSVDDRRKVLVDLTPAGRAEAHRLAELTESAIERIFDRIPADRRQDVIDALVLLEDAVGDSRSCC